MTEWQEPTVIEALLEESTTWAVVGLSDNTSRPAYGVARVLQEHGKTIVPIHPAAAERDLVVHGEKGYPTLADVPFEIDVVDVFRRADAAGEFADEAVAIKAKGVWFQLGVVDEHAFRRATTNGLLMVMDLCPAIEWRRRGR